MVHAEVDERALLRESAERFVAARPGDDPGRYAAMADLGWLEILVPESAGGFGGSCADAAVIAEALGFGLVDEPFVRDAVLDVSRRHGFGDAAALDRARVVNAAEQLGVMRRAFRDTVAHVNAREQFGRPIAAFQVVRHRIADLYVECELATAAVDIGLEAVERDGDGRAQRVAMASYQVSRSGRFVCEWAVQLHGAMGLASETPVAGALARMTVLAAAYGDPTDALQRFLERQGT